MIDPQNFIPAPNSLFVSTISEYGYTDVERLIGWCPNDEGHFIPVKANMNGFLMQVETKYVTEIHEAHEKPSLEQRRETQTDLLINIMGKHWNVWHEGRRCQDDSGMMTPEGKKFAERLADRYHVTWSLEPVSCPHHWDMGEDLDFDTDGKPYPDYSSGDTEKEENR